MVAYLRAANVKDGRLELDDVKEMDFSPSEQRTFGLAPGDVLVSEGAGSLAAVGASAVWSGEIPGAVCYQNTLLRLRPRPGNDPRYLMWWARHAYGSGVFASIATGANIYHLGAERVRLLPAWIPSRAEQREIADYLDRETTRIDRLIAIRTRQIDGLAARTESLVADLLDPLIRSRAELPLKAVADLRFSNVDKKSYDDETPVLLCNYTDVYYNRKVDSHLSFMEATANRDQIARLTLRAGDVLLTKDSETAEDIAVPALVTEDLPGVVLGYHLALARPTAVDGAFLYWALRSRRCRDAFSLAASGVTRFGLRQDAVGRIPIPNLDRETAAGVVDEIEHDVRIAEDLAKGLGRQIELLVERRQALITAAVTGQLEIPGVAA